MTSYFAPISTTRYRARRLRTLSYFSVQLTFISPQPTQFLLFLLDLIKRLLSANKRKACPCRAGFLRAPFLDTNISQRTLRYAVVLFLIEEVLDRAVFRHAHDMALASRITESDEKARIPVRGKREKLLHLREFHRAQHG